MPANPRVDQYIADAPLFAQPILEHLRASVHKACPELEESIKWSRPVFLYRKKMLCMMAAFKAHCSFGFWKQEMTELLAKEGIQGDDASGSFGRITALSDLPSQKDMQRYLREALRLLDEAPASTPKKRPAAVKPEAEAPPDLASALEKNKNALNVFKSFSPSHRREYIEWITEAKREETRQKRIATALEWLTEGKPRNWKYQNC